MEILPDVHRIETIVAGRRLFQFFLAGQRGVLVDAGEKETPHSSIFPCLEELGFTPASVKVVIVTHADTDHHGGIAAVKRQSPRALITCGLHDRRLVEDPDHLLEARYRAYELEHRIGYSPDALARAAAAVDRASIDITWTGGERLMIAPTWELEIVATPGHSRGHLAVHDLRHNALYCGDAVHGSFYPTVENQPALPPNYVNVDDYLQTIARLEQLEVQSLHGSHWPAKHGPQVARFLGESRTAAERLSEIVTAVLTASSWLSLCDIIKRVRQAQPDWQTSPAMDLAYSIEAHLTSLVHSRRAQTEMHGGVRVYRLAVHPHQIGDVSPTPSRSRPLGV